MVAPSDSYQFELRCIFFNITLLPDEAIPLLLIQYSPFHIPRSTIPSVFFEEKAPSAYHRLI